MCVGVGGECLSVCVLCVCVCMYVSVYHTCAVPTEFREGGVGSAGVGVIGDGRMETELCSSARAVSTLNHQVFSPTGK